MLTPAEYEAEIDRLGQALRLEADCRKFAADLANERGELLDEACALLDEMMDDIRPSMRQDARSILRRANWR
jgi:hypothetical protein